MATKTKPRKVSIDTLYGFGRDSPEERRCRVRKASAPLEVRQMLDGARVVRAFTTRSCGLPRAGWMVWRTPTGTVRIAGAEGIELQSVLPSAST